MRLFIYFLLTLILSCEAKLNKNAVRFQGTYNLENPEETIKLNKDLIEISGLSTTNNLDDLLAINDEKGNIYEIGKSDGIIRNKFDFESKGDYEGIEQVEDKVYVIDNSGDIFVYKIEKRKKSKKHFKTHLSSKNDVEGLTYNKEKNELLLACKGDPGKNLKKGKAIYAFDLEEKKLEKKPKFLVKDASILIYIDKKFSAKLSKTKLNALKNRAKDFAPSGLTIHPINKKIYILSSRGKLIVVLKPDGNIDEVYFLNDKIFFQPEGICIDQNLTLYISSEGKTRKSKLFAFKNLSRQ